MCLAACTTGRPSLTPLPPVIETVAVYRDLPSELRRPCDEPRWDPAEIVTDVDLLGLLSRYRSAYVCTAAKILAIDRLYAVGTAGDGVLQR